MNISKHNTVPQNNETRSIVYGVVVEKELVQERMFSKVVVQHEDVNFQEVTRKNWPVIVD